MPGVGLGCWKIPRPNAAEVVESGLTMGYRHLDCACDYGNEAEVGAGLKRALDAGICTRDDVWVTSKLWNTYHAPEHVRPALERSLRDLQLDHLDLYLIHFPIAQKFVPFETRYPPGWVYDPDAAEPHMEFARVPIAETWGAMEDLVESGLVRSIGVCNFGVSLMRDLLNTCRLRPQMLQVELHPYLSQEKLLRYCRSEEIAVTGFSPLGALSYVPIGMAEASDSLLDEPVIVQAAERNQRTPAQIVLRWGLQRGYAVVPKTTDPVHLQENLAADEFELSEEEMQQITALDRGRRYNDPGEFCETAFGTFCPIYE